MSTGRVLALVALGACAGSARRPAPPPEREPELDLCLGDNAQPLDPAPIAAAWQQLARGEHPAPLHLKGFSAGVCEKTWWQPVEPLAACGVDEPRRRTFAMKDAGTIVVDVAARTFSVRPPGEELFEIDGTLVTRSASAIRIETARGSIEVPGFPERVIDDGHAIISNDQGMAVYDLVAGREVLQVRPPRSAKDPEGSVAATEVIRDPASPLGASVLAGMVFGSEWEAFAIDPRGKLLASVRGPTAAVAMPVVTADGTVVLVAYRDAALDIRTVDARGKVIARTVPFDGGAHDHLITIAVAAAGDAVVVGFSSRAAIVRPGADPVAVDVGSGDRVVPALLAGGNVAVIVGDAENATFVVDTRTGTQLARVGDREPRFTVGGAEVVVVDAPGGVAATAIVVSADGTVRRGPLGTTTVGRYPVRTLAGVPDPAIACDARALSILPPLLRYGDWFLPVDLVVD